MQLIKRLLFSNKNPAFGIFRVYVIILALSSILLMFPFLHNNMKWSNYVDALFMAQSAFSTTGLTVLSIFEKYNFFGQLVVFILIEAGAVGIMTVKVGLMILLGKKIALSDRLNLTSERGSTSPIGIIKMFKTILIVIFSFQIIMALFFIIINLQYINNPNFGFNGNIATLIWSSLFHSVSSFANCGLDVLYTNSLVVYSTDYLFLSLTMLCIIFGGIGFPVIFELVSYFNAKRKKETFKFSLYFKIAMITYFTIMLISIAIVFGIEILNPASFIHDTSLPVLQRIYYVLFTIIGARNAGFATISPTAFSSGSQIAMIFVMWIGASPSSTGGGIRGTTFFLVLLGIYGLMKGKNELSFKTKSIAKSNIDQAFVVISTSMILICSAWLIISGIEPNIDKFALLFEIVSAFGTTGFSLGITPTIGYITKLILVVMMFVGQLGITNTLLSFNTDAPQVAISLPEETIPIS